MQTFYDLFAGGGDVGLNVEVEHVVLNDTLSPLMNLYKKLQQEGLEDVLNQISRYIVKYSLSKTNKQGYLDLRTDYNNDRDELKLLLLISYGFNNQIRFNKRGKFNIPFGKREFNKNTLRNLTDLVIRLKERSFTITDKDYSEYGSLEIEENDFVFCDPPYLITDATYNTGWSEEEENRLYQYLDGVHKNSTVFMLTNMFAHKGKVNHILRDWLIENGYCVMFVDSNYNRCSYQTKNLDKGITQEIIVTNKIKQL